MPTVSPVTVCLAVAERYAGGHSPTVPSAELTVPQQRLDLTSLGFQARGLRGGTAAVCRHVANQSLINVETVEKIEQTQEMEGRSQPPH